MKDMDHNKIMNCDWIMGSCLMFEKNILEKINGGFDERFFMYFEDTDLCRRIKSIGKKVVYNPEAEVIHDHSRDSAREAWYISPFVSKLTREHIKSYIKYFLKWYSKE
jgi:GT2 family glycosyltransferase